VSLEFGVFQVGSRLISSRLFGISSIVLFGISSSVLYLWYLCALTLGVRGKEAIRSSGAREIL